MSENVCAVIGIDFAEADLVEDTVAIGHCHHGNDHMIREHHVGISYMPV